MIPIYWQVRIYRWWWDRLSPFWCPRFGHKLGGTHCPRCGTKVWFS